MKLLPSSANRNGHHWNCTRAAVSPTVLVAVVAFALGAGVGAFWVTRHSNPTPPPPLSSHLSGATHDVLKRLSKPVALRFYSLLDPAASSELRAFSERAKQLLLPGTNRMPGARLSWQYWTTPPTATQTRRRTMGLRALISIAVMAAILVWRFLAMAEKKPCPGSCPNGKRHLNRTFPERLRT